MKIAVVHDWLVTYAGSERVLEQIVHLYPQADLFSIIDFLPDEERKCILNKTVQTSFIQKLPFAKSKYRQYLSLMPLAIERFDLSAYDLVISSNFALIKGIITGPDQLHISYTHSPVRYAWDLQHQYLTEANLQKGIKGLLATWLLQKIRLWDYRTPNGVDFFIANSHFISRRIWKVYRRESTVIYPPVDIEKFVLHDKKEDYYLTASRLVPYKRIDLIVDAFSSMPDKRLIVIGDGPDYKKIKSLCRKNIELMGYLQTDALKEYMQRCKAFVFAAEEDFGIIPVEAQACGTPVIAYGKGGVLDTVTENKTGLFFHEQTKESLISTIQEFEKKQDTFIPQEIRKNAERFSPARFKQEFKEFVDAKAHDFWSGK